MAGAEGLIKRIDSFLPLSLVNYLLFHVEGIMKSDVPDFGIELAKVPSFLYYRLYRKEGTFLIVRKFTFRRNKEAVYDYR